MIDTAHRAPEAALRRDGAAVLASVLKWSLAGLFSLGFVSLVLAMAGFMQPWITLPLSLVGAVLVARRLPGGLAQPVKPLVAALVGLIILAFAVFGVTAAHEHVLGGRDPGTYVATASWVARTGGLWMDVGDPVLAGIPITYETNGFPAVGAPDLLRPQFLHLFPSLLSAVAAAAEPSAMFLVTPLIGATGLLALFAFGRSIMGSWASLAAILIAALSLPFFFFYRAPFSEVLMFTFLFGGLWVLERALTTRSTSMAVGAGLLFGGVLSTRIDGVLVLLGLTAFLVYLRWIDDDRAPEPSSAHLVELAWRVSVGLLTLAVIDGVIYSPAYLSDHGTLMGSVLAVSLLLKLAGHRARPLFIRHRHRLAGLMAALMTGFFAYAALIRPSVAAPTREDIYGISGLQEAAGVAVEPMRTYAELSVHWLAWYLGVPLVLAALVAVVVFSYRVLAGRGGGSDAFVIIVSVATVVYILRPSINPDHIWAMRRFVPLVIPGLTLLAFKLGQTHLFGPERWRQVTAGLVVAVVAVTVLLPTTAVGRAAELSGAADDVSATCELLGTDSTVLFVGEKGPILSQALAPVLRGWCGATVAIEPAAELLDERHIDLIASRSAEAGRSLWLVGDGGQGQETLLMSGTYEYLELTLFAPPDSWLPLTLLVAGEPR